MNLVPMMKSPAWPSKGQRSRGPTVLEHTLMRDNFTISTWLAMGAVAQGLLAACLPLRYALLPAPALLLCRLLKTMLVYTGVVENELAADALPGKYTMQIPGPDGEVPASVSENGLCLLILASRSNHPLGMFSPELHKLGAYMDKMRATLEDGDEDGNHHGFLGQNTFLAADERKTRNQFMMMCYFRSVEDAYAFAHGPAHREAWQWWHDITRTHPDLSIRHELYMVPPGHWENICINSHPTGIAGINAPVRCEGGWTRPLFDARKLNLRTTMGRLNRTDGSENEKYGPDPYSEQ